MKDIEDDEDRDLFLQLIEALDIKYIELVNAKLKTDSESRKGR